MKEDAVRSCERNALASEKKCAEFGKKHLVINLIFVYNKLLYIEVNE